MSEKRRGRGNRQNYYENDARDATMRMPRDRDSTMNTARATMKMVRLRIITTTGQSQGYYNGQGQGYYEGGQGYYGDQGPQGYYGNGPQGYYQEPPRKKKKKKKKERFSSEYPSWCF